MIYGAKLGKSSFSIIVQTGGGEKQSKQRNRETFGLVYPLNSRIQIEVLSHVSRSQTTTRKTIHGDFMCPDLFEATLRCHKHNIKVYSGTNIVSTSIDGSCSFDDSRNGWVYPMFIETPPFQETCLLDIVHVHKDYEWLLSKSFQMPTIFDEFYHNDSHPTFDGSANSWWSCNSSAGIDIKTWFFTESPYTIVGKISNLKVSIGNQDAVNLNSLKEFI